MFNKLPDKKVLIISNHQTYFADVSFIYMNKRSIKAEGVKCPILQRSDQLHSIVTAEGNIESQLSMFRGWRAVNTRLMRTTAMR